MSAPPHPPEEVMPAHVVKSKTNKRCEKISAECSRKKFQPDRAFILRLPDEMASKVTALLEDEERASNEDAFDLAVQFHDKKSASVRVDGLELKAEIFDLPAIVEVHQHNASKVRLVKLADVGQLINVSKPREALDFGSPFSSVHSTDEESATVQTPEASTSKRRRYRDGLTPPLRRVKQRFRKTKKHVSMGTEEIHHELKMLLLRDLEAKSTRYELVDGGSDEEEDDGVVSQKY